MILKLANGRTINYAGINKNTKSNLEYIDKELQKAGYGYIQRLAILGNVQRESSGNPLAVSSNGLWHGIIQWDKNRYRIQSNNPKEELKRQTALLIKELEKKGWSGWTWKDQERNAKSFRDSSDLKQAVDIFTRRFVRPGDIEGEITKRFNFAKNGWIDNNTDPEYDIKTALEVLPKQEIKAWQTNPEKNHLSTGYTDKNGNYHYLKSSQHESYNESREYERKDPKTIRAMSVYGNANDYVSKFPIYSPVTSGLPQSVTDFDPYNKTLIYRSMVLKNQTGGLIYTPFIKNNDATIFSRKSDLERFLETDNRDLFPVEAVQTYVPVQESQNHSDPSSDPSSDTVEYIEDTQTTNPISTQTFHKETKPPVIRGVVEFKHDGLDIGNMRELVDLMQDEGISFRVTSGNRPGAKTSSGRPSHHGAGNALDITPIKGQTWDDLLSQMRKSEKFIAYMHDHGLGILDERSETMQKKTRATGAHFHIGPDQIARTQFKYLVG